jgi:hypothetical protein
MGTRLELQAVLEGLTGSPQVYFQPPANVQMVYPCIVYKRDDEETLFADNSPYHRTKRYLVTVIDLDPDSEIPDMIGALPLSRYIRNFVAKNLNHDVYVLYF